VYSASVCRNSAGVQSNEALVVIDGLLELEFLGLFLALLTNLSKF